MNPRVAGGAMGLALGLAGPTPLRSVAVVLGCSSTVVCPAIAVAALRLQLRGLPTAECTTTRIDVRDDSGWSETVHPRLVAAGCEATAAVERSGTFAVVVRAAGRPEHSFTSVAVQTDPDCGTPIPVTLPVDY
ncbi:MAG: hypothetical protein IPJ34_11455 [Myxococcales bacterium]|nr:hypothetical protein [Myxococcales bacterium]